MTASLDSLLQQLIDLEEETAVAQFIAQNPPLQHPTAINRLLQTSEKITNPRTRIRIEKRLKAMLAFQQQKSFSDLPLPEQLYILFRQIDDSLALQSFVLHLTEEDLDTLEETATAKQSDAAPDEQKELAERLTALRRIRQHLLTQFGRSLPFIKRINAWLETNSWQASQNYLRLHKGELLSSSALEAMQLLIQADPENPVLLEHARILEESQKVGVVRAFANRAAREAATALPPELEAALTPILLEWIQQPTLADSEAYLQTHSESLLTNEAEWLIRQIVFANAGNPHVHDHYHRLQQARKDGVPRTYVSIRKKRLEQMLTDLAEQGDEMETAVVRFVQCQNEDEAAGYWQETAVLHTQPAGELLSQLADVADTIPDTPLAQQITSRFHYWQAHYREQ
ncbi:MAG: hypothetical protein Kow0080_31730 [Candidatus Promineifilaceae bacterium]